MLTVSQSSYFHDFLTHTFFSVVIHPHRPSTSFGSATFISWMTAAVCMARLGERNPHRQFTRENQLWSNRTLSSGLVCGILFTFLFRSLIKQLKNGYFEEKNITQLKSNVVSAGDDFNRIQIKEENGLETVRNSGHFVLVSGQARKCTYLIPIPDKLGVIWAWKLKLDILGKAPEQTFFFGNRQADGYLWRVTVPVRMKAGMVRQFFFQLRFCGPWNGINCQPGVSTCLVSGSFCRGVHHESVAFVRCLAWNDAVACGLSTKQDNDLFS